VTAPGYAAADYTAAEFAAGAAAGE
jgi:hypothetical protein